MKRAYIAGFGDYLPQKVLTNADIEKLVDTNDAWIVERTGIKKRHIAAEGEMTSEMAAHAARAALADAGITPAQVDLLIVATTTPDDTIPSTATKVQHLLGMKRGAAFDLQAACSGFVYALATADSFIRAGQAKWVLVIGAEIFSRILDWKDRSTCILFGDGAGAVVLGAVEESKNGAGVLACDIYSDGKYAPILKTNGGVASTQTAGTLFMAGQEVFKHAVAKMADAVEVSAQKAGVSVQDIDWLVPHQANSRILGAVAKRVDFPEEKVISTVGEHANTSAASIPLALAAAHREGKLKKGNILALPALGAGLTWGCCIIRL